MHTLEKEDSTTESADLEMAEPSPENKHAITSKGNNPTVGPRVHARFQQRNDSTSEHEGASSKAAAKTSSQVQKKQRAEDEIQNIRRSAEEEFDALFEGRLPSTDSNTEQTSMMLQTTEQAQQSEAGPINSTAPAQSFGSQNCPQINPAWHAGFPTSLGQGPQQMAHGAPGVPPAPYHQPGAESSTERGSSQQQNELRQAQQMQLTPQQEQVMDRQDLQHAGRLSTSTERIRYVYSLRLRWNHYGGKYMQEQTKNVFLSVSAAEGALATRILGDEQLRNREVKLMRRLLDGTGTAELYLGQYQGEFWRVDAEVVQMAVVEEGGEVMWVPRQES